jgi:hypothetical protein
MKLFKKVTGFLKWLEEYRLTLMEKAGKPW